MSSPLESLVGKGRATVVELLAARTRLTPEAMFLRWMDQSWTYAEGFDEIKRFADWAQANVSGSGERPRIASFLGNRPETVWTWFGALASGAIYVPLNYSQRGDLLRDMLRRARADLLVTDLAGFAVLPPIERTSLKTILLIDGQARQGNIPDVRIANWSEVGTATPAPLPLVAPADLAEVMYTSGTTGRSKAVQISHNQLCRGASAVAHSLSIGPEDVFHAWLPLYHMAGQVDSVLCTVIGGGTVALQSTFSRSRFWREVEDCGATIFAGFSNVIEILWAMPPSPDDAACSLRAGMIGAIPPGLHREFEERFGVRLCDVYGLTEAEPLALPEPGVELPVGACGRANPDFEMAVLDEDGEVLPAGEVGELVARPRVPDVMFAGYEGDEGATVRAWRNLWFHTGDLGRMDSDGLVYFVDRRKHAIRHRGENISSWELEGIVAAYPGIAECCAVGVASALGEEDVMIVVAPIAGEVIYPAELRSWCEWRMARFMVPRYIQVLEELPRDASGKVQKEQLRQTSNEVWDAEAMVPQQ